MLYQDEDKTTNLDGDNIEVVDRFSYLRDVFSAEGGAQKAVTSRIRSAWRKFVQCFACYIYAGKAYHRRLEVPYKRAM